MVSLPLTGGEAVEYRHMNHQEVSGVGVGQNADAKPKASGELLPPCWLIAGRRLAWPQYQLV